MVEMKCWEFLAWVFVPLIVAYALGHSHGFWHHQEDKDA